jgi:tRNA(fMet)-specific endonuclease VapC
VITVSELLHGAHRARGALRSRRIAFAEHLLASLAVVPISTPVARLHAEVHADLAADGQTVGAHDLWIGATALAHDFGIVTRNERDFRRIPGLRVVGA